MHDKSPKNENTNYCTGKYWYNTDTNIEIEYQYYETILRIAQFLVLYNTMIPIVQYKTKF